MRASALPLKTSNRFLLAPAAGGPGIGNQNDTSTCEGHAHGYAGSLMLVLQGLGLGAGEVLSPVALALGAYMFDRLPNIDGTLPNLIDQGTMPSSILQAWASFGADVATAWGQFPASSSSMYIDPTGSDPKVPQGACIEPPPEKLYAARPVRFTGAYFVTSFGVQKAVDVMTLLAAKQLLSDAIPASGQDFQGYNGGILGPTSGQVDHAQYYVDYEWTGTAAELAAFVAGDTTNVSKLVFYKVNSWGEGWGESDVSGIAGGLYRCNYDFLQQSSADLCALTLKRVAS